MKTILTFGVFDMLHLGHILLFKHVKELFPNEDCELVVAVQDSDFILKYKPGTKIVYNTDERLFMVHSIRYVDKVVAYSDVDKDIQKIPFDVFAKGPDQQHIGFQKAVEWCEKNDKQVIIMPRTEGISSTQLRKLNNK